MRYLVSLFAVLLVVGCGNSSASAPTPTIPATAVPATQRSFASAPPMTIDKNKKYLATVQVSSDAAHGSFTIQLLPKVAPIAVNNFVFLARHHFYNGIIFHRVIKGFMVQTGDPTGTGTGGPGYMFKDEKVTLPYVRGTVAMANSGPNTNGSQFFIIVAPKEYPLPPSYTIFGRVIAGMNVVQQIADVPVTTNPAGGDNTPSSPMTPVKMVRVTIH